jgi:Ca2+-binding EF-hand superfamily protein
MAKNAADELATRVFARFVQQKLRGSEIEEYKGFEVKDLIEEMKDSVLLVNLMEVMSGKLMVECGIKKRIKPEKMRIKMITNANEALKYCEACGVDTKTIRISAENIVDGATQDVLALIFQIIVKYLKFDEDDDPDSDSVDIREGLCLWLNNKVDGYSNVDPVALKHKKIPVKRFHNGLIFNALVHKMRPKLVNYAEMDEEEAIKNLENALSLGEKYLNIEKYINAEEIQKLDELSMIVYLSDWFTGVILLQKQDVAARRVGKLVDLTILHDKLRAEYTEAGAAVKAWADAKIVELNVRAFDDTLAGVKKQLEEFYNYKGGEKGEWVGKQLDATGLFNNLQARLTNHKRPAWRAPEGTNPEECDALFETLAEAEIKRSIDLNQELARQVRLHKIYKRFQGNAAKLNEWVASKEGYVNDREAIDSVEGAQDALETLGVYEKEQEHVSGSQLKDLVVDRVPELVEERFEFAQDAQQASANLESMFKTLADSCKAKHEYLNGELQKQKDIDEQLCKAFADAAHNFELWLKTKRDGLGGGNDASLEDQLATCRKDLADTAEADAKLADIKEKDAAVAARNIGLNPHSNTTAGDQAANWSQFQLLLKKKEELLLEQIDEASRGGLTPEQTKEIDENFSYFDKDNSGALGKKELRVCLQSLGEESRPKDIAALLEEYDTDKSGTIAKAEFVEFMKKNLGDSGTEPEMVKAFEYLCFEKEIIVEEQLVNVVNDKSFKDHHVEYLKKECQPKDGGLDYKTWTSEAFAR